VQFITKVDKMGYGQSKEDASHNNIAIAEVHSVTGQVDTKLNYFGIILLVISVVLVLFLLYFIYNKCRQCIQSWLQKAVARVQPATVVVHREQAQPQPKQQPVIY
jgi:hypothetical protein